MIANVGIMWMLSFSAYCGFLTYAGPDSLKHMAKQYQAQGGRGAAAPAIVEEDDDDDVPELVEGESFETKK